MIVNPQENSSLLATITTKVGDEDVPAISVSTSLNASLTGFMLNVNVINLDVLKTNASDVQQQFNDYIANTIKTKMLSMGYPIVLT